MLLHRRYTGYKKNLVKLIGCIVVVSSSLLLGAC